MKDKPSSPETTRDPDFIKAERAIKRAAKKARQKARTAGTGVVFISEGKIVEEKN
jgi:hypothetical protein